MTKRALVFVLIAGSLAGTAGAALADAPGVNDKNHNVCLVFSPNQKYTNASYVCVSTPDVPPG